MPYDLLKKLPKLVKINLKPNVSYITCQKREKVGKKCFWTMGVRRGGQGGTCLSLAGQNSMFIDFF